MGPETASAATLRSDFLCYTTKPIQASTFSQVWRPMVGSANMANKVACAPSIRCGTIPFRLLRPEAFGYLSTEPCYILRNGISSTSNISLSVKIITA